MKVKICGIPSLEVAKKVCPLRPDAIGIYIDKDMGANATDIETAKQIIKIAYKYSIETFFLTCLFNADSIATICDEIGNSHVQLTSKTKEEISIDEVEKLKIFSPEVLFVKVIGVIGQDSEVVAKKYEASNAIDQLLLDTKVGNLPGGSGTGITHDWNISKEIVLQSHKPVWLAGGIKLNTVQKAITTVNPYGIDIETGVQNQDGSKNYEVIKEFISLVHSN